MNFGFSEEQNLMRQTIRQALASYYGPNHRDAPQAGDWRRELWRSLAELGVLALPYAAVDGGLEGGPVETMILMEEVGRALALEPYLATFVLGSSVIRNCRETAIRQAILPELLNGRSIATLATLEPSYGYDTSQVSTVARQENGVWRITGQKDLVPHGCDADIIFVTARMDGSRSGFGIFMVNGAAFGVLRASQPSIDGRLARIDFSASPGTIITKNGTHLIALVTGEAIAALCAEAVGAMDSARLLTIDYLKTRTQFGVPLARFQALRHRAATMLLLCEQARSMACYAALMLDHEDTSACRRALSAAKVQVGRASRLIAQEATQMHGGIGVTADAHVSKYVARLLHIDTMFGNAEWHLGMLADDEQSPLS